MCALIILKLSCEVRNMHFLATSYVIDLLFYLYNFILMTFKRVGLVGFNVGLERLSGLLPMVWDSFILGDMPSEFSFATEGMAPPIWYSQRYNLHRNLEDNH